MAETLPLPFLYPSLVDGHLLLLLIYFKLSSSLLTLQDPANMILVPYYPFFAHHRAHAPTWSLNPGPLCQRGVPLHCLPGESYMSFKTHLSPSLWSHPAWLPVFFPFSLPALCRQRDSDSYLDLTVLASLCPSMDPDFLLVVTQFLVLRLASSGHLVSSCVLFVLHLTLSPMQMT